MTVAHEIKYPWKEGPSKFWPTGYRHTFITIWHVDPCKDGTDDSCGWFQRARHGNIAVLDNIVKRLEFDWDRVFKSDSGNVYHCGLFCPNGDPNYSVSGIVLNLFFSAAFEYFGDRDKAHAFCQKHLFEILLFAENPVDSMSDGITQKFGAAGKREDRIRMSAASVYSWILRASRPWWKHPRWHFWHWKIQCHPLQLLKRSLFSRCAGCGKRFKWSESCVTNTWESEGPRWFRGQRDLWHDRCHGTLTPLRSPTGH